MIRASLFFVLIAGVAHGQSRLEEDLDRARDRYQPAAQAGPSEVDRLAAQAGEALQSGDAASALVALDKAAGLAFKSGATGRAFELSLTAAELQRAAGQLQDASQRFAAAALSNPRDPRAVSAHWTACETLAATLTGARDDRLDEYDRLLAQHISTWPTASTATQAVSQRIELLAKRRRWVELLDAVRNAEPSEDRDRLLVAAHAGLLAADSSSERFAAARDALQPIIVGDPVRWPDPWSPGQRSAALALSRAALDQGDAGIEYARRLLNTAVDGRPAAAPAWRVRAVAVLTVAALATDDIEAARKWAGQLGPDLGDALNLLATASKRITAPGVSLTAESDRLAASVEALTSDSSTTRNRAAALADAGRDAEALRLYQTLAEQRPGDKAIQLELAKLLETADPPGAAAAWRRIEARTARSTDAWFEARLGRVRSLAAAGQIEEARKLLKLTRLLAPSLGGDVFRRRFDDLTNQIGIE